VQGALAVFLNRALRCLPGFDLASALCDAAVNRRGIG